MHVNRTPDFKRLAKCEIGWWQAHHRRDKKKLFSDLVAKHSLLFGIDRKKSGKAIDYFFKATKEHDIAEKLEDSGKIAESNVHWKRAENLLEKYFRQLFR